MYYIQAAGDANLWPLLWIVSLWSTSNCITYLLASISNWVHGATKTCPSGAHTPTWLQNYCPNKPSSLFISSAWSSLPHQYSWGWPELSVFGGKWVEFGHVPGYPHACEKDFLPPVVVSGLGKEGKRPTDVLNIKSGQKSVCKWAEVGAYAFVREVIINYAS